MPTIIKSHQTIYCQLVEFMSSRLPKALVIHHHVEGYGTSPYIEQVGTGIVWPFCHRNHVATISDSHSIDLYDGAWFSDIEDVVAKYEKYSKEKATITIHEVTHKDCNLLDGLGE